jgi:hypothetical protein
MSEQPQSFHDFGLLGQGISAHGTRANYQHGCRCTPCRSAEACYQAQRVKARAAGLMGWVEADQARQHLLTLAVAGIGLHQAAYLSGVSFRTLQAVRNGRRRHLTRRVAATILATKAIPAYGQRVPSYHTRQLLQSLRTEGYPLSHLAYALGLRTNAVRLHHASITVRNALKVRALYRRLLAE